MKRYIFFLVIILFPATGWAAEFYFGVPSQEIPTESLFEAGVFLNTENERINAIQGSVLIPETFVFKEIRDGGSIVNFWIQGPTRAADGSVSFAGVIPGGFQGQRGYLFSLILESGSRQDTIIRFDNTQALLNDGSGTPAAVRESPLELRVREGAVVQRYELAPDFEPPESFGIEIARDPSIFDGRWFIVFAAHDKLSGLGSYEVWEQPPRWSLKGMLKGEEWVRGQSPYVLTDQTRRSTVLVRATDRAGNRRVERLSPSNNQAWFRQSPLLTALLLGVFAVTVMAGLLWRRKFK